MDKEYRFTLEEGSRKHMCPQCDKKRFVAYIDTHTGEYLPEEYGRCDRQENCGYHLSPYKDGYSQQVWNDENPNRSYENYQVVNQFRQENTSYTPRPQFYIPSEVYSSYVNNNMESNFVQNLIYNEKYPFNEKEVKEVANMYQLGNISYKNVNNAVCFPFIDQNDQITAIQVKQFDYTNHTTRTNFIHSVLERQVDTTITQIPKWINNYNKNDKKVRSFFGTHLLSKYPHCKIGLVEAPKTAIYATLYYGLPQKKNPDSILWLATYSLDTLTLDKCLALKDRTVILFPDTSKDGIAYKKWTAKMEVIKEQIPSINYTVSDYLEQNATEQQKKSGYDLADFLREYDWRDFRSSVTFKNKDLTTRQQRKIAQNHSYSNDQKLISTSHDIHLIKGYLDDNLAWLDYTSVHKQFTKGNIEIFISDTIITIERKIHNQVDATNEMDLLKNFIEAICYEDQNTNMSLPPSFE